MASVAQLRAQVRREAVEPAGATADRIAKLVDECISTELAARSVLDGATGGVTVVPRKIHEAIDALRDARKNLLDARKQADEYEKSL